MDDAVEFVVSLAIVLDLPDRVNDRAVMFSAKSATNLGKRVVGQLLAEKHGDLARVCDSAGIAP